MSEESERQPNSFKFEGPQTLGWVSDSILYQVQGRQERQNTAKNPSPPPPPPTSTTEE